MNIHDREIVKGYNFLKRKAIRRAEQGRVENSITYVEQMCLVANELNWMYHDEDMSILMDSLSKQMLLAGENVLPYNPIKKRIAFYDQYGKPFILALQYIDALSAAGYDILYILSDYVEQTASTFITDELMSRKNIIIEVIPNQWSYQQRAQKIQELTLAYCPARLFMHVKAFSAFNLVLPSLPRECVKYYIDLQDHAFWIKNHQLDYVMPYRVFGATIDIEKRGFKKSQVLLMPYYPVIRPQEFGGFPDIVKDKVIIFSGGDLYKTIDEHNSYWTLVKRILSDNPSAIILFAGKSWDARFKQKIQAEFEDIPEIANRFVCLSFRQDINEVFQHADIYLATTPMSGGLMCQYAAVNAKPILQYYPAAMASNNETEQVINYNSSTSISYTDMEALLQEAKRLVDDIEYRRNVGEQLQRNIIKREQFDDLLARTIEHNENQCTYEMQSINYEALVDWWFSIERQGFFQCRIYLLSIMKKHKYLVMPLSSIWQKVRRSKHSNK